MPRVGGQVDNSMLSAFSDEGMYLNGVLGCCSKSLVGYEGFLTAMLDLEAKESIRIWLRNGS